MPLYDSGTPIANVALNDTFNTWRIRTNQINTQAAGLTSNNVFTGANNTFNSVINAARVVANTFAGDGSGLTGLSAGLDWSATTTNDEYNLFLVSNTSGSGIDQFEVGTGITFNPSTSTLTLGGPVAGAISTYANTTSNTTSANSSDLITKGGLLNYKQDSETITSVAPTNVGSTSNGHIWYVYG
jgi:hypothetical protein